MRSSIIINGIPDRGNSQPTRCFLGKNACYGLPDEAAKYGEVVVLSVPWTQALEAIKAAGSIKGKILIDCTNPLKPDMGALQSGIIPLQPRR
ncbi:MAG: NAD(P)-binding domain-containing protein [Methanotrichaceae archaeon]|nr:NAD(P)-binding domain-containing protein [Methanotrichaceae archaeon]MDD1758855.1 NAD(P)-binding domain-containing protein [Methanotrichaceae archaeon]